MRDIAIIMCVLLTQIASAQNIFHVSPHGMDTANGAEDSPLASVQRALELASGNNEENIVFLHGGIYRPQKPLLINKDDASDSWSVKIRSYGTDKVTISGAIPLKTEWKIYRDGIMCTKISPPTDIDMLIVNGEIRHMARFPNFDSKAVRFNGTSADATSPERIRKWKHPEGGFLHAMHQHDWGDFHYRINGKDTDSTLILTGGHQNNRQMGLHHDNRMVENIFEELDAPGEWYYDKKTSVLYYFPCEGENPSTSVFETPRLKHIFDIRGTEKAPVRNVTIEGLDLTATQRTFMEHYEPLLRSDWTIYRGGAILMENTENCVIKECNLYNLGGNGIFFSKYNRHDAVEGNHFHDVGASAVLFVGDTSAVRSPAFEYWQTVDLNNMDFTPGAANDRYPAKCRVYDNLIHDIGLFEKQITGVELSMCQDITVSHNSIYDVPRAAINVSEGTWGGHIIEYNDIFNTVKETGDHGAFNSWGRDRFWHPEYQKMCSIVAEYPELIVADVTTPIEIRNNRFRCDRGWDIDLDDGSSNYHIYNNLCLSGGIKLREGFYRKVENNILVNNTFHPHVWFANSGDIFTNNIVMSRYQPINLNGWGACIDRNIFLSPDDLRNAQEYGTDSASLAIPFTFVNYPNGDYRIDKGAVEAFRIGFHNFDMDKFGVVSPRLKKLAKTPAFPVPLATDSDTLSEIINWQGWSVKNMDTEGERSATGMDSVHGVYVVTLNSYDSATRDYLCANDVIIAMNGMKIDNLEDLTKATASVKGNGYTIIRIFRHQRPQDIAIPSHLIKL